MRLKRKVKQLNTKAKQLDGKAKRLDGKAKRLEQKVKTLEEENRLLKLQIEEYRKKFFKKNKDKNEEQNAARVPRKRGAPKGHPGTTRRKPDRVDEHIDVFILKCPKCGGKHLKPCTLQSLVRQGKSGWSCELRGVHYAIARSVCS